MKLDKETIVAVKQAKQRIIERYENTLIDYTEDAIDDKIKDAILNNAPQFIINQDILIPILTNCSSQALSDIYDTDDFPRQYNTQNEHLLKALRAITYKIDYEDDDEGEESKRLRFLPETPVIAARMIQKYIDAKYLDLEVQGADLVMTL